MNIEILRIQEDYVTTTTKNFYLNFTEWLASPGGTKFWKSTEEMSNVFGRGFAPLRGIEMAHCQFTKVYQ